MQISISENLLLSKVFRRIVRKLNVTRTKRLQKKSQRMMFSRPHNPCSVKDSIKVNCKTICLYSIDKKIALFTFLLCLYSVNLVNRLID